MTFVTTISLTNCNEIRPTQRRPLAGKSPQRFSMQCPVASQALRAAFLVESFPLNTPWDFIGIGQPRQKRRLHNRSIRRSSSHEK